MRNIYNKLILLLILIVLLSGGCIFPTSNDDSSDFSDLMKDEINIGWISRLPEMDYVVNSPSPDREGWAGPGQEVTWRAQVKNWTSQDIHDLPYQWLLDGKVVAEGKADLKAGEHTPVDFRWDWTFDRHELELVLNWASNMGATENDTLEERMMIYTDALAIGFWVERSLYEYFRQHQHKIEKNSYSFEDYAQRHINEMNRLMAEAIYPETPSGALDRVRLQKIVIVEDGGLPIPPGSRATHYPDVNDRSVDMMWGFPSEMLNLYRQYVDQLGPEFDLWGPFDINRTLIHELGHARYLIDVYQYKVYHDVKKDDIQITENGHSVVNTKLMPAISAIFNGEEGWLVYQTQEKGLMNTQYDSLDRYSTMALNLIAGHRAVDGNFNSPANLGEFVYDLPQSNRLTIIDNDGKPVTDADVRLYQSEPVLGGSYSRIFDDLPDLELRTDVSGSVMLDNNPFSETGELIYNANYFGSNLVAIIRVEKEGYVGYSFLEHYLFNLEYWRGQTSLGEYTLQVNLVDTVGLFDGE